MEVVRASYMRALKCRGQLVSSLALPHNPKDLALEFRLTQKDRQMQETAIVETHGSPKSQEMSIEVGGPALKKIRIYDLATAAKVVNVIPVKALRKKLRRPVVSGQFRLVGSLLGDSDSSIEDCEVTTPPSPAKIVIGKEPRAPTEGVDEVRLETNPEPNVVNVEDQSCPSSMSKELSVVEAT
ncbi:hypothetical protein ACFE04_021180 [Oxalis oulophora]